MKILGLKTVLLVAVWAGLCAVGVANGQIGANPTHDGKTVMNGAPKRTMTFADLMAMKRVSDPQISPSGRWVMFSVMDVSLEKNTKTNHLWVVSLNGGDDEKQVTFGDGETFGQFSPDGRWVSYTAKEQIVMAPWDEAAGKVGDGHAVTSVTGGADGAIWSPNSKRLMFTADVYPACSVKGGKTTTEILTGGQNDEQKQKAGILRSAQNDNLGGGEIAGAEPATWAEEDACDKAKDEAADKSPVKAQVWDSLLYRHWDQYTGQKRSHILVVDSDGSGSSNSNNGLRDLTPASAVGDAETPTWFLGAPLQYAWAPDSKEIAYVTNLDPVPAASTNNDVFTLRLDEPGAKAVKVSTSPGSDDAPAYSPDGKWLAFRSQKQAGFESDKFRLMLVQRVSEPAGQRVGGREWGEPKELMPKFDNWVDEFAWVPDSAAIVFTSGTQGMESVYSCNVILLGKQLSENPTIDGLGGSGEYSDIRVMARKKTSDDRIVASRMAVSAPSEIVTFDAGSLGHTFYDVVESPNPNYHDPMETGEYIEPEDFRGDEEKTLTHINDSVLSHLELSRLGYFWFSGADGTKVQAFMLKPPNFDPAKKYPVKFVMHGGPQTALGDMWSYRWNWELLAADGYVVVGINRRGSTGYGQKFVDEVSGDWGGRAYEDLMKGLDYAETKFPFIDKTRECALGASYGGFMADWVLTHTNRFKCIVTHDGMFDPASAYGTTEEMWFNEWEFRRPEDFPKGWDGFPPDAKQTVAGHAAEPWRYQNLPADQDPFRKWSPMRFIENAKTPTLIIHSQKDYRLDVSQGFELYTALQRRGVPARFLYFPDEGHWVLKPQNSQLWYETVDDWCDRWTKSGKYAETK
jgi:dipeptidyl aminopeptidase/acylaminoacyl peptidase